MWKNRIKKLRTDNKWKEEKLIELEIKRAKEIHELFERYSQNRQNKVDFIKKDITEKERKIREQEQKEKAYMELLKQTEDNRKQRDMHKQERVYMQQCIAPNDSYRNDISPFKARRAPSASGNLSTKLTNMTMRINDTSKLSSYKTTKDMSEIKEKCPHPPPPMSRTGEKNKMLDPQNSLGDKSFAKPLSSVDDNVFFIMEIMKGI